MKVLLIVLVCFLSSCSLNPTKEQKFGLQSCFKVYCDSSEDKTSKLLALKAIEYSAKAFNINLDTEEGICTKYYKKREIANGYVYLMKSAKKVCSEFKESF